MAARRIARGYLQGRRHLLLLLAMVLLPLLAIRPGTWLVLTLSGLAMGNLLFLMSAGMSLTFGLMNVLNLAHGAFISLGAFAGSMILIAWLPGAAGGALAAGGAITLALAAAAIVAGLAGLAFERWVIRPVYGDMLRQILVTVGGAIIITQIIQIIWGAAQIPVPRPEILRGSFVLHPAIPLLGGAALEKFRLASVVLGLATYAGMILVIEHTRVGILIRTSVEDREMVEALGHDVRWLLLGTFVAGCALAGAGGVLWAMYQEIITAGMGDELLVLVIVVVVLGGLGSVRGCFHGALLVGLVNLYVGYLTPSLAAVASVALMVGVLLWRPAGLLAQDEP